MTITYTNTRRDLLAFQLHRMLRSPVNWLVAVACQAFMGFLLFFQAARDVALAPRIVAAVFFLLLLLPIFLAVQVALLVLSLLLRQTGGLTPEQVTLGDTGIQVETATVNGSAHSLSAWSMAGAGASRRNMWHK